MASKRKAITELGNSLDQRTTGLPNRAVIQRARQEQANGSPNDNGVEAAAIFAALKRGANRKRR